MRQAVLWDSSAILALLDAADADHERAVSITRQIATERRPSFITNYIEAETHALLLHKLGRTLALEWLERLPLFLKVVEMESLLSRLEYRRDNCIPLLDDGEVGYLINCIEQEIPYLGFFDPIFSAEEPFSL